MATSMTVGSLTSIVRTLGRLGGSRLLFPVYQGQVTRCLGTWHQIQHVGLNNSTSWPHKSSVCSNGDIFGPTASHIATPQPLLLHVNTMKKRTAIKRRCKDCKIVIKDKRAYVICKTSPRHNQMQG